MKGTTPEGTAGEQQAAEYVRGMFAQIAPRYDLLNHLLSFNIDRYWRSRTVDRLRPVLNRKDARVIDLCCGTGDLTLAFVNASRATVFGSDFCHPMLTAARTKSRDCDRWFEADALRLPVADASIDLVSAAFGFRNLANYDEGLKEMRRVLRPGGVAAILEFSQPPNPLFASLYGLYSKHLLPRIGGMISGSREAYKYLPESVRKFPNAEELAARMGSAGFADARFERMTFGVVALHTGQAS
jgi:demethylmenaquinone methyltransferase / 2-methoxy-6-polyprenyl-1,4-benzoquinol methylase